MSRECFVSWGQVEEVSQHKVRVTDVDTLDSALDAIELSAMLTGATYEVDLWLSTLRADDPILLQFLIGHPERSSLLWHEDGKTMIAVGEHVRRLDRSIECERPSHRFQKNPELTLITPTQLREALALYLLLDRRPDSLSWAEAEQD